MKKTLGAAAFAAALLTGLAASPALARTFQIGAWTGNAFYNDNGSFSHCAVTAPYRSNISLSFSVSGNGSWRIGFGSPAWNLRVGGTLPVTFWVDNAPPYSGMASVRTNQVFFLELPQDRSLVELMRHGMRMAVLVSNQRYAFELKDTSIAIAAVEECAAYRGQPAPRVIQPPQPAVLPPAPPQPVAPGIGASERAAEAMTLIAGVVAPSGIKGFRVVTEKKPNSSADGAWSGEGLYGEVRILPGYGGDDAMNDRVAAINRDDAAVCKFRHMSSVTGADIGIRRIASQCQRDSQSKPVFAYYLVKPRREPGGGLVMLSFLSFTGMGPAVETERKVARAVLTDVPVRDLDRVFPEDDTGAGSSPPPPSGRREPVPEGDVVLPPLSR